MSNDSYQRVKLSAQQNETERKRFSFTLLCGQLKALPTHKGSVDFHVIGESPPLPQAPRIVYLGVFVTFTPKNVKIARDK